MTTEAAPLAGLTVLALEQAIAAPLCTRHLADLGNLAPGALGRLGLAPDDLAERYPRLIVVDLRLRPRRPAGPQARL